MSEPPAAHGAAHAPDPADAVGPGDDADTTAGATAAGSPPGAPTPRPEQPEAPEQPGAPEPSAPTAVSPTADLLRGIRQGSALSAAAFACAAVLVHHYMEPDALPPGQGLMRPPIPECLVGLVAWGIGRGRLSPTSRLMICVLTCVMGLDAVSRLVTWAFFATRGSWIVAGGLAAGAVVSLTIALALDLLLCRGAGGEVPRPRGPEAWLSVPLGRRGRIGRLGALAALLVPVLAVAALALVPNPVTQTTAPSQPDDQLPAVPASVSGEISWQLAMDEPVVDVAAGKAGPVLITGDGLIGLSGNDGSTLWSYRHARGTVGRIGAPKPSTRSRSSRLTEDPPVKRSVTSPDGSRIAVALAVTPALGNRIRVLTLVLDTVTGRVIMEHTENRPGEPTGTATPDESAHTGDDYTEDLLPVGVDDADEVMPAIQMTDSVVLIDSQAFSLADGSLLWKQDPKQDFDERSRFSGTAGHHTLIAKASCEGGRKDDPRPGVCGLTLIDDDDPTSKRPLNGVVGGEADGLTVVDGWVVRYSHWNDNTARADSDSREAAMEALDIDSLSDDDSAAFSNARVVELGEFAGPDPWSSRSFIALRRGSERADRTRESGRGLKIAALFDPSTGTVTPVDSSAQNPVGIPDHRSAGWATTDTAVAAPDPTQGTATGIALTRPDGSAAVTVKPEALLHAGNSNMNRPQVIAAPGAVVMWATFSDSWDDPGAEASPRRATLIYGLR